MAAALAGIVRVKGRLLPESLQIEAVGPGGKLVQRVLTYTAGKDGERVFDLPLTDHNKVLVQQLSRLESVEFVANKPDVAWVAELDKAIKAKTKAKS